jgi:hypothetical protein
MRSVVRRHRVTFVISPISFDRRYVGFVGLNIMIDYFACWIAKAIAIVITIGVSYVRTVEVQKLDVLRIVVLIPVVAQ